MLKKECIRFANASKGLYDFFKTGFHAKLHLLSACIVITAGFYFHISTTEWIAVLIAIALVIITEAINECIEHICNFIHLEQHLFIRKIKDMSAGTVLFAAGIAALIGTIIFIPKIF